MKTVYKFDGRCLIDADTLQRAASLVSAPGKLVPERDWPTLVPEGDWPTVVVIAALAGTTDALDAAIAQAQAGQLQSAEEGVRAVLV